MITLFCCPQTRAPSGWGDFNPMIEVLENRLKAAPGWLLGEPIIAADVLEACLDRCLERPA